jgi:metal-dependent amidase/aminoacylase/carboxypeptidase family protein
VADDALDQAKTRVTDAVDRLADDLEKISHQIHATPELCFHEEQAAGWLSSFLERQ